MITIELLKQRTDALIDEMRRIEGAIKENKHIIAWMENEALNNKEEKKVV